MTPQLSLDLTAIKAAMASTNAIFNTEVFGKRNYSALTDVYTEDARILPPGAPMITGLPGITTFWSGAIEGLNATSCLLESVDVMPSGDGVVEIGNATLTIRPEGQEPAQLVVKYVVIWKNVNGNWKWDVDIWNMNA